MRDYTIIPPTKEELTAKGFTNRIKIKDGVTEEQLINYGFTNHSKPILYFSKIVGNNISFNLSVNKSDLKITAIDVLDENFLQPYDYQNILMNDSNNPFARGVFNSVDKILNKLQGDGIVEGYERGMYI